MCIRDRRESNLGLKVNQQRGPQRKIMWTRAYYFIIQNRQKINSSTAYRVSFWLTSCCIRTSLTEKELGSLVILYNIVVIYNVMYSGKECFETCASAKCYTVQTCYSAKKSMWQGLSRIAYKCSWRPTWLNCPLVTLKTLTLWDCTFYLISFLQPLFNSLALLSDWLNLCICVPNASTTLVFCMYMFMAKLP